MQYTGTFIMISGF
uniref:Uncharacterized protein n=1 Tax=Rhizophora mucronata TaxID=61149 RepID=A0A2P2IK47_RHIMU